MEMKVKLQEVITQEDLVEVLKKSAHEIGINTQTIRSPTLVYVIDPFGNFHKNITDHFSTQIELTMHDLQERATLTIDGDAKVDSFDISISKAYGFNTTRMEEYIKHVASNLREIYLRKNIHIY